MSDFVYYMRQPFSKQQLLFQAIKAGAARYGDRIDLVTEFSGEARANCDGLVIFGIGGESKAVYDAYRSAGKRIVFLDKGYSRGPFFRVAVDDYQPTAYFQRRRRDAARLASLGVELRPYRKTPAEFILFDGASNKFGRWIGENDFLAWGAAIVDQIRQHSKWPVIYRPRPTHNEPVGVPGAELSVGPLAADLKRARLVVSYGGNIGFDAVVAGIPHFAIGNSIARPLSQTEWRDIDRLVIPTPAARRQWCADVSYCQWTLAEFSSGEAWADIKETLDGLV